jgi:hypothetical protein
LLKLGGSVYHQVYCLRSGQQFLLALVHNFSSLTIDIYWMSRCKFYVSWYCWSHVLYSLPLNLP